MFNMVSGRKLLDQVRDTIRFKHYSARTEQACVQWIKRHIFFHNVRHPVEVGGPEVKGCFWPGWPSG